MRLSDLINKLNSNSLRQVAKELNVSKDRLFRFLKLCEKQGYIISERKGRLKNYTVLNDIEIVALSHENLHYVCASSSEKQISSSKQSSATSTSEKQISLRYHNLVLKVPLISGDIIPEKVIRINGVEKKIFKIENLAKAEIIEGKNKRTLIVYFPQIKTSPANLQKTITTYTRLIYNLDSILRFKYRVFADFSNLEIVRQHISFEGDIPDFPLTTIKSDKKAESIANYKENAWLRLGEKSEGIDEIETNDINFAQAFYQMPFKVEKLENTIANKLTPVLEELSKQIKLHLEVMQEIKESIKEMRDIFKKLKK